MRQVFALSILLIIFSIQVTLSSHLMSPEDPIRNEKQIQYLARLVRTKVAELSLTYHEIEAKLAGEVIFGRNKAIEKKKDMLKILSRKYNANKENITDNEKLCIEQTGYKLFLEENSHDGENNSLNPYWNKIQNCSTFIKDQFTSAHLKKLEAVKSEVEMEPSLFKSGILDTIETVELVKIKGDIYFGKTRECMDGVIDEFSSSTKEKKRLFFKCMKIPNKSGKSDVKKKQDNPVVPVDKNKTEEQIFIRQVVMGVRYAQRLYRQMEWNLTDEVQQGRTKAIEKKKDMLKILAKKYNASKTITEKEERCIRKSGYNLFRETDSNDDGNNSLSQYWDEIHKCSNFIKEKFTTAHYNALNAIQLDVKMGPHLMRTGYLDTIDSIKLIRMKAQAYYGKIRETIEKSVDKFVSSMRDKKRIFLKCIKISNKSGKSDD